MKLKWGFLERKAGFRATIFLHTELIRGAAIMAVRNTDAR